MYFQSIKEGFLKPFPKQNTHKQRYLSQATDAHDLTHPLPCTSKLSHLGVSNRSQSESVFSIAQTGSHWVGSTEFPEKPWPTCPHRTPLQKKVWSRTSRCNRRLGLKRSLARSGSCCCASDSLPSQQVATSLPTSVSVRSHAWLLAS